MSEVKIIDSKGNIRKHDISICSTIVLNPGEKIIKDASTDGLYIVDSAMVDNPPKPIKIHFEISAELWHRANRYITNYRMRHEYAKQAFIELINRKEGRDKKLQAEKMVRDSGYIQDMIDKGLVKFPEVK